MSTIGPDHPAPLRVGLIGYGLGGRNFHAPLLTSIPGLRLVAIASSRLDQVAADHPGVVAADPAAVIASDEVDLVVITTPNASHAPLAAEALRADKAVVVDKPFALDLAEARGLVALAAAEKQFLSVFHNRRWDSDYLGVASAIRSGTVGRVTHFESHTDRFRPTIRDRWRERAGPEGGLWADLGPHLVDQTLQLFGLPRAVLAHFATQRVGSDVEDWAHVILDYGAMRAVLHMDSFAAGGTHRFTVHGEGGSLVKREADPQDQQVAAGLRPGQATWGVDLDPLTHWRPDGTAVEHRVPRGDHAQYYRAVRDALQGGAANPVPPIQAMAVMAVLDAGCRSARSGQESDVDLTTHEVAAFEAS